VNDKNWVGVVFPQPVLC